VGIILAQKLFLHQHFNKEHYLSLLRPNSGSQIKALCVFASIAEEMIMSKTKQISMSRIAAAVLVTLLFAVSLQAQEFRGLITGQVVDSSGAAIPNATITALREGTQQPYTVQTNSSGAYSIPYVLPGSYEIRVEATGFKKAIRQAVNLDVAQKLNLNIVLEVGSISETVTVQEAPSLLSTGDASGGTVIDAQNTQNLPLNGRQIYTLMLYAPGVRYTGGNTTRGWDQTNAYVINGVQNNYNQFTLNGAPISQQISTGRGTWFIAPNVDSVQEVKIQTNTYDASYGRSGGGTVNVVTKAGTKNYHGTAFDFWRGSSLEANTFKTISVALRSHSTTNMTSAERLVVQFRAWAKTRLFSSLALKVGASPLRRASLLVLLGWMCDHKQMVALISDHISLTCWVRNTTPTAQHREAESSTPLVVQPPMQMGPAERETVFPTTDN
jgi:hypothetical protein